MYRAENNQENLTQRLDSRLVTVHKRNRLFKNEQPTPTRSAERPSDPPWLRDGLEYRQHKPRLREGLPR